MKLSKGQREQLKMKFGGRCAYCGRTLPERWNVDHLIPVLRKSYGTNKGVMQEAKHDNLENMMPSCPACNISKGRLSIEGWRSWLAGHMRSLNEHHSIYRLMIIYGCVVETGNPIIFYFENAPNNTSYDTNNKL